MKAWLAVIPAVCLLSAGCLVTQLEVTNPIPGLSRVAVAPFFNLSHEEAADGRRVALAYFTELQKVPGFQVVPVGITEQVIFDHRLQMDQPEDVLRLAEILKVDAVVVGSVTDYDPYYPPRIGMQVSWYSPHLWQMFPGVQVDPHARRELQAVQEQFEEEQKEERRAKREALKQAQAEGTIDPQAVEPRRKLRVPIPWYVRGQSPEPRAGQLEMPPQGWQSAADPTAPDTERLMWRSRPNAAVRHVSDMQTLTLPTSAPVEAVHPFVEPAPTQLPPTSVAENPPLNLPEPPAPEPTPVPESSPGPLESEVAPPSEPLPPEPDSQPSFAGPALPVEASAVPVEPIMAYTRMFDGADADLVAALRDYVELSGDKRSGGWEAYLHRSEDFIRFTAHRMILEMLMLHGGEGRRRIVIKHRNVE